jgi:hypothetical protein
LLGRGFLKLDEEQRVDENNNAPFVRGPGREKGLFLSPHGDFLTSSEDLVGCPTVQKSFTTLVDKLPLASFRTLSEHLSREVKAEALATMGVKLSLFGTIPAS